MTTKRSSEDRSQMQFKSLYDKRRLRGHEKNGSQYTRTLWDLLMEYHHGKLVLPPHQRQLSWDDTKQLQFLETLFSESMPPGCFEMYQVFYRCNDGDGDYDKLSTNYLNDGCQRLLTAYKLWQNPLSFGVGQSDVEYILRNTTYPVNHKYHNNHQEALERFQCVNSNWPLTPYQKTIGDIVYCEGDDRYLIWQEFVDGLHTDITKLLSRCSIRYEPKPGAVEYMEKLHLLYRHDLSLLLRFASGDRHSRDYKTSSMIGGKQLQSGDYFEKPLSNLLNKIGYDEAVRQKKMLIDHLTKEVALVEYSWERAKESIGGGVYNGVLGTTVRWILDTSIWIRNNRIDYQEWSKFVYLALRDSQGSTTIYIDSNSSDNERPRRFNFTLSRMEAHRICSLKEWGVDISAKERRYNKRVTIKPGYDFSHLKPFVSNGDGDGFWEPSGLNRSRRAREVAIA